MNILTIDSQNHHILREKVEIIQEDQLLLAIEIGEKLISALKPYFPAAGLAAPQIGMNKAVFIFSFDRDPKNLEVVMNPSFIPLEKTKTEAWEGCFSTILCERDWKVAKVSRYDTIQVAYLNQEGKKIEKILKGFGARVFQHECDHLQGIVNIDRQDAEIKSFNSKEEMLNFLQTIKEKDSLNLSK